KSQHPDHHFYPRPPRGGRRKACPRLPSGRPISTHALREEGDSIHFALQVIIRISTHALREEGDTGPRSTTGTISYFYPRPPRGGRRKRRWKNAALWRFLPTPSARRATSSRKASPAKEEISTHALREEGDIKDA